MELLFPSPVMHFDWPDSEELNRALRDVVLARRTSSCGTVKTNRGGWQSNADMQDWQEAPVRQLLERMTTLAREYVARQTGRDAAEFATGWKIRAWANINEHGHYNRRHDHLGVHSFFSGVYYVNVGDITAGTASGGRTRFEDCSFVAIDVDRQPDPLRRDYFMTPRNGRMLLFPASLMHSVEVYGGTQQRITIAFNLYHPSFTVPRLDERLQASDWWLTNFRGLVLLKRKIPEKLYALVLLPRQLLARRVSNPLSLKAWGQHIDAAMQHATALASEHFETKRNA
ncbi:TIGR02466 family protein [Pseudoduganella sp.]|uniref:TIGR02466 family protein n=1 Tax=Pseudoduganella sp. TaxID=1880898 RepID=UPI0035B0F90E